ncbi:hypothetical protein VaNZ11_012646 [Volvox africanus]|uniref:Prolyl 4-hydroxylase alpha subunit domain-containing protein n=1 Tax=Volvox africanus TaxID=51714 RepID=A0ABQ5SGG3_9CHLO|nr:hypothetical protein VaNZ11_012646 [Volvox africanus]
MRCPVTDSVKCRGSRTAVFQYLPSPRVWSLAGATHRVPTILCHVSPPQNSGSAPTGPLPSSTMPSAPDAADAASVLGAAWDPEGLFSNSTPLNISAGEQMGDLIARRERERAARRGATVIAPAAPAAQTSPADAAMTAAAPLLPLPAHARPLWPLPDITVAAGGLRPEELPMEVLSEVESLLARDFMAVDLRWPGLRLLHLDPPVITVDNFLTGEQCDQIVQQAELSGRMQASRIGASNVSSLYGNASSSRRTSTGMMVTPGVAGPIMDTVVSELQFRGKKLLRAGDGPAWGPSSKMPHSGQYCYEALQVARYDMGQHFLAHEDGFPAHLAASNGFQRHATLLVYLNDVLRGGATRFNYLGLAVQPVKGKALLFFPAFSDGTSDVRSLHTAEDAVDTKYATQQWVARGLPKPTTIKPLAAAAVAKQPQDAEARQELQLEQLERAGRQGKGGKTAMKGGKGFGSKPGK